MSFCTFRRRFGALLVSGAFVLALSSFAAAKAGEGYAAPRAESSTAGVMVQYPEDAQRIGEEGSVVMNVYVTTSGRVADLKLMQSSGFDRLDNAAIGSVLSWRFQPAQQDGKAVAAWTPIKIDYKLRESARNE